MKNIVILISGGGSNMRALVEYVIKQKWEEQGRARVAAVISNNPDAAGLVFADECGITTDVVNHRDYSSRAAFEAALSTKIDESMPDVILLAGFMRILTAGFTHHYERRMFNVHPSILPLFKGLHTHALAIESGAKLHGATIHGVTAELDHGPIVMQSCVPVFSDDSADRLAARVLKTEHVIYPQVLDWWVNDRLVWDETGIKVLPNSDGQAATQVLMMNEENSNERY